MENLEIKINQSSVSEILKTYKETLIETIESYLPMSYEDFKTLDLDEQQKIIDDVKLKQGKVEKDMYQERLEELLMLPPAYSRKKGKRIKKEEAKIPGIK